MDRIKPWLVKLFFVIITYNLDNWDLPLRFAWLNCSQFRNICRNYFYYHPANAKRNERWCDFNTFLKKTRFLMQRVYPVLSGIQQNSTRHICTCIHSGSLLTSDFKSERASSSNEANNFCMSWFIDHKTIDKQYLVTWLE